jgi:hypothetical protein
MHDSSSSDDMLLVVMLSSGNDILLVVIELSTASGDIGIGAEAGVDNRAEEPVGKVTRGREKDKAVASSSACTSNGERSTVIESTDEVGSRKECATGDRDESGDGGELVDGCRANSSTNPKIQGNCGHGSTTPDPSLRVEPVLILRSRSSGDRWQCVHLH